MIGTLIEERYRIVELVGEGGMGSVYKAVDEKLRRTVALKLLRGGYADNPSLVKRFNDETQILASFNHPNITLLYDAFTWQGQPVMVMELLDGEPLSNKVNQMGPVPAVKCVPWILQALAGVAEAHQHGIIHRDLKPSNLMLTSKGIIKVMDFGIAKSDQGLSKTRTATAIGTPYYMAPEQIEATRFGLERADHRADIYAMGVTLYELLAGVVPFQGSSEFAIQRAHMEEQAQPPTNFYPHIPPQIVEAVSRAMAKAPHERFQSAAEFAQAINLPEELLRKGAGDRPVVIPAVIQSLAQPPATVLEPPLEAQAHATPLPPTAVSTPTATQSAAATPLPVAVTPPAATPLPVTMPYNTATGAAFGVPAQATPIPVPMAAAPTPLPLPVIKQRTGAIVAMATAAAVLLLALGSYGFYAYQHAQSTPSAGWGGNRGTGQQALTLNATPTESTPGRTTPSMPVTPQSKPQPENASSSKDVASSLQLQKPAPHSPIKEATPVHTDNTLVAGHWSGSYRSCESNQETHASLQLSETNANNPTDLIVSGRLLVTGRAQGGAVCPLKGLLTRKNNRLTLWVNCGNSAALSYLSVPYASVLNLNNNELNGTLHPDNPCYTIEFKRDGGGK